MKIDKSPRAVAERRQYLSEAIAIAALEGHEPTETHKAFFEKIVLGEQTTDEAIAQYLQTVRAESRLQTV